MQVQDVMKGSVVTASEDETIAAAAGKMRDADVGCVVVVGSETLRGIITDRDVTVRCCGAGHNPQECSVAQHMTSPVTILGPDLDVLEALHLMAVERIKRVPIMQGAQLVGILSFSDIAIALGGPTHDLIQGMGTVH